MAELVLLTSFLDMFALLSEDKIDLENNSLFEIYMDLTIRIQYTLTFDYKCFEDCSSHSLLIVFLCHFNNLKITKPCFGETFFIHSLKLFRQLSHFVRQVRIPKPSITHQSLLEKQLHQQTNSCH